MQFQLKCVRDVISLLVEPVFLFIRLIKFWSHVTYLTLKNDFLNLKFDLL